MKPRRSKSVRRPPAARSNKASGAVGSAKYIHKNARPRNNTTGTTVAQSQTHHAILPFLPTTPVLLVGEGNLSFAACLADHHQCTQLTVTTFDTQAVVEEKYGSTACANVGVIEKAGGLVCYGVDATKLAGKGSGKTGRMLRSKKWGAVIFMFPHTGGLTKDVDRQVRANQELLLGFFKSAYGLLLDDGIIVVTLFTGPAYEAWNVKELGKMAGLRVRRSYRFEHDKFPGYSHARTLGTVQGKGGAWKGEEREARTWVFEKNDGGRPNVKKRKRAPGDEVSSEEDERSTPSSKKSKPNNEKDSDRYNTEDEEEWEGASDRE